MWRGENAVSDSSPSERRRTDRPPPVSPEKDPFRPRTRFRRVGRECEGSQTWEGRKAQGYLEEVHDPDGTRVSVLGTARPKSAGPRSLSHLSTSVVSHVFSGTGVSPRPSTLIRDRALVLRPLPPTSLLSDSLKPRTRGLQGTRVGGLNNRGIE